MNSRSSCFGKAYNPQFNQEANKFYLNGKYDQDFRNFKKRLYIKSRGENIAGIELAKQILDDVNEEKSIREAAKSYIFFLNHPLVQKVV